MMQESMQPFGVGSLMTSSMPLGSFVVILTWWNLQKTKRTPFMYTYRSTKKKPSQPLRPPMGFFTLTTSKEKTLLSCGSHGSTLEMALSGSINGQIGMCSLSKTFAQLNATQLMLTAWLLFLIINQFGSLFLEVPKGFIWCRTQSLNHEGILPRSHGGKMLSPKLWPSYRTMAFLQDYGSQISKIHLDHHYIVHKELGLMENL